MDNARWVSNFCRFAKDAKPKEHDSDHAAESSLHDPIPDHSAESSLYRHEIEILLQERTDMGLHKLNQAELESLLAGVLGALEQARGTSLGLLDTMPKLFPLRHDSKPHSTAASWVRRHCHCLSHRQ
jgi:hypothetical protein